MNTQSALKIFEDVISRLQADFPQLQGSYTDPSPVVDRAYEMQVQPGLTARVHLNLQDEDELHLGIGLHFWCEWFPCARAEVVADYFDAVAGFLYGRYRVVDFYRGPGCYKSQLQGTDGARMEVIANSIHLGAGGWHWMKRRQEVIQNLKPAP
jgi:hypothetical protein